MIDYINAAKAAGGANNDWALTHRLVHGGNKRVSLRRPARRGLGQVPTLVVLQKFAKVFFV